MNIKINKERVLEEQEKLNLNESEFANLLGLTFISLYQIKHSTKRNFSYKQIVIISKKTNKPVDYFLCN